MEDDKIIEYLESHAFISDEVKDRCIEAIKGQEHHRKVEEYSGNHYCECGCPVEYFIFPFNNKICKQAYCSDCGARLDWEGVEITVN